MYKIVAKVHMGYKTRFVKKNCVPYDSAVYISMK